jgi:hypothetical protein
LGLGNFLAAEEQHQRKLATALQKGAENLELPRWNEELSSGRAE